MNRAIQHATDLYQAEFEEPTFLMQFSKIFGNEWTKSFDAIGRLLQYHYKL